MFFIIQYKLKIWISILNCWCRAPGRLKFVRVTRVFIERWFTCNHQSYKHYKLYLSTVMGRCARHVFPKTNSVVMVSMLLFNLITVKPVFSGLSNRRPKVGFQDRSSLNAGQKYCRMLQESILQYFRPSLSYHLSLRPLFCLFLSGPLRQVLLYTNK